MDDPLYRDGRRFKGFVPNGSSLKIKMLEKRVEKIP